jgi:hypothetical protein
VLRAEQDLRAQAQRLRSQLDTSVRRLHVAAPNVRRVVDQALALAGQLPLQDGVEPGTIAPPDLRLGWERTLDSLPDPLSGELRPLTFDSALVGTRQDVVLAHLGHPLVVQATRLLRSAVWGGAASLHRATAVRYDPPAELGLRGPVVVVIARLVVVGADGGRLHEEVVLAGRELPQAGRSKRLDLEQKAYASLRAAVEDALEPGACRPAAADPRRTLARQWAELTPLLVEDVRRRAEAQRTSVHGDLERQRDRVVHDTAARYAQLRQTLLGALEGPGDVQLVLGDLDAPERAQVDRDRRAWQTRLDRLEADRDAEVATLSARYADVRELVFPFAVVLAVP